MSYLRSPIFNPHLRHGLQRMISHIRDFGYSRKAGDKMPRANAWRPYRFAVQDVIFAATALRHAKEMNCIEVDVFLTAEIEGYEEFAAVKALTLMLLSEAFRCGAAMMLKFTKEVEDGWLPMALLQLAARHNIWLSEPEKGVMYPREATQLYMALSEIPSRLNAKLQTMELEGLVTIERACYLVNHGVWSVPELEGLVLGCPYPELVLNGEVQPELRHLYNHVQMHTRSALIGGMMDRALATRTYREPRKETYRPSPETAFIPGRADDATVEYGDVVGKDVEDDERDLMIAFEPSSYARVYLQGEREVEPLPIPDWRPYRVKFNAGPAIVWNFPAEVPRLGQFAVLLRPRDEVGMLQFLDSDLNTAIQCRESNLEPAAVAVLVPLDFNDLNLKFQREILEKAARKQIGILVCPETTRTLDGQAREKLNRSRVLPE